MRIIEDHFVISVNIKMHVFFTSAISFLNVYDTDSHNPNSN